MSDRGLSGIIVTGPTGVGKTALSLELARGLAGEVISVDAIQVYRGAAIGSNKLALHDRRGVVHHLLDTCELHEQYDAGRFLRDVEGILSTLRDRLTPAIFVGGSTMYISLLLNGLAPVSRRDAALREELSSQSSEALYTRLANEDPESAAKLHPHDRVRIIRALEIVLETGRVRGEQFRLEPTFRLSRALVLVLCRPREVLRDAISRRSQEMVEGGLIEETAQIMAKVPATSPILSAIGYRETVDYLTHGGTRDELTLRITEHTSQYAKRQRTFWRNEPKKRGWEIVPPDALDGETERMYRSTTAKGFRPAAPTKEEMLHECRRFLEERGGSNDGSGVRVWYISPPD